MPERNFRTRVDRWLRREDTFLAKSLRTISPKTGAEYRRSTAKRVSEYVIIAPIAPIAAAAVGVLAALAKAEDRGPASEIGIARGSPSSSASMGVFAKEVASFLIE
jgi:hypothetical protein